MGYTVTNYGNMGRLAASVVVGFLFYIGTANAQFNTNNNIVFIQAAGIGSNPVQTIPVLRSPTTPNSLAGASNDVWPKLVQFQPVTEWVEPYIQNDMSYGLQYTYQFYFELSARNNNGNGVAVPDGWYQLQIAVVKISNEKIFNPNPQPENPLSRYVTSTSAIVKVTQGSFSRKVSLRFPKVIDTALKHHLYIELIPLDNNCNSTGPDGKQISAACIKTNPDKTANVLASTLKPLNNFRNYLIEMPFVPKVTSGTKLSDTDDINAKNLPFEKSLADYIAAAQLFQGQERRSKQVRPLTPEQYAAEAKLHYMTPDDPFFEQMGSRWKERGAPSWKEMFESILRQRSAGVIHIPDQFKSMFSMLCEGFANKNQKYNRDIMQPTMFFSPYGDVYQAIQFCQMFPERDFRITRVIHIGKPLGAQYKRINQGNYNYNLMSNFALNRSSSRDTFQSYSFKPASILFNFISSLGLGMGFVDIGVTNSVGNSRSTSGTGIASMGMTLDFTNATLNIPTVNSTACLEIRPAARAGYAYYDFTPGAKNGFYICDKTANIDIPETFAHVFIRCGDSGSIECYDPVTQSMNFSLRGEREISGFLYAVRKMINPEGDNVLPPFAETPGAEQFFRLTSVTGNMRYITPIEFPTEAVPSFMGRLLYMYGEKFDQQFAQQ